MTKRLAALATSAVTLFAGWVSCAEAATATGIDAVRSGASQAAGEAGLKAQSAEVLVGQVIQVLIGFTGVGLVVYLVWGGVEYMMSRGEKSKVEEAKKTMTNAVIGIIIVLVAYAASVFVLGALQDVLK